MKIKDFKVGQEVLIFVRKSMNSYTTHTEVVVSIGRKYVKTVKPSDIERDISKNCWFVTEYYCRKESDPFLIEHKNWGDSNYLFPNENAFGEYMERKDLFEWLSDKFRYGGNDYTLEQLREVKKILENEEA